MGGKPQKNMHNLYEQPHLREISGDTLRPGGLELTRRGVELCGWRAGDRVLDIGCGPGESLGLLRESGLKACGLDKSESLLAEAARRGPVLKGEATNLPLRDRALEGALSECVLSLLPDKPLALKEIRRVLKPGGRLLLSDLFLRRPPPGLRDLSRAPCATGAETLPRLRELLHGAGFTVAHCQDASQGLVQLAVNMIFKYGSTAAFYRHWGLAERPERAGGKNLGYVLLIAEAN